MQAQTLCLRGHDTESVGRQKSRRCKQCHRDAQDLWRKENPEKRRQIGRQSEWKQRGFKKETGEPFRYTDFDRLYQYQQGRCKICSKHSSELSRPLSVDHNHQTGYVRGLLCQRCNILVGFLETNNDLLSKAKDYLK